VLLAAQETRDKAANDGSDAIDFIANMKQTGAGGFLLAAFKNSAPPPVRHPPPQFRAPHRR
jgi:hypothetical protein